jgi:3-phenylpropionate/trans-cinnamate dioxygenase ferredoxin component
MAEHVVCRLDELPEAMALPFEIDGVVVAVVRIGASVYAIEDRCSHQDVPLSEGSVDVFECSIECIKHGSMFDLRTGDPLCLPATRPVPVYKTTVRDGDVVVMER